jgi:hypothetical protein
MQLNRDNYFFAVIFSVALHVMLFALASNYQFKFIAKPVTPKPEESIIFQEVLPPAPEENHSEPTSQAGVPALSPEPVASTEIRKPLATAVATPVTDRQLATMAAPPAPTAEEWAFAAKYTLKNSKGYRHTWGQQVRSMMGTAVEGPNQGAVRFRVEIAADGALARLETLWTTSALAEQLARKAMENMPPLPPTPTGKPLIFEKTISFSPFTSDAPPIYKDDCLPDPPTFRNPFAWDGKAPQVSAVATPVEKPDPQDLEGCLKKLPQDSIEAESARDQRQLDQWGSSKLGR